MEGKIITHSIYFGHDDDNGYYADFELHGENYLRITEYYAYKLLNEFNLLKMKNKLKPISELIEKMTYDGKTFIPLQELFYMVDASNYIDYSDIFEKGFTTKFQIDDDWNHVMTIMKDNTSLEFCYDKWSQSFTLLASKDDGLEELNVTPQYPLFKKLIEWGFDIDLVNEQD